MECKRCTTELKKDEERDCLYCPVCHPPQVEQKPIEEKETRYVDVKLTFVIVFNVLDAQTGRIELIVLGFLKRQKTLNR